MTTWNKTGIASIDKDTEILEGLEKRSRAAKGLVGKLFSIQVADGYAYYTVEAEKGRKVLVKWHELHDAYRARDFKQGGWFNRYTVEAEIDDQEGMAAFLEDHGNKMNRERAKRRESVVRAVFADLGQNAGIYDLASWCWQRGHYGKKADARIYQAPKVLGRQNSNDLANDLAQSKEFPAIKALKNDIEFAVLADAITDPAVYKNAPPSDVTILNAVREYFQFMLGVRPLVTVALKESEGLASTQFDIIKDGFNKIGSVTFDPKNGKILNISIAFERDYSK